MRQRFRAVICVAAAPWLFATAACGGGSSPGIDGTWDLVAITVDGNEVAAIAAARPSLVLAGGRVSGDSGCNMYSGRYRLSDGRLVFEDLTTTERACLEPERNEQESRYYAALADVESVERDSDALRLFDRDGAIRLHFEPRDP